MILNSLSTFLNTETKKKNTVEVFRFGVIWKFYQLEGKHIFIMDLKFAYNQTKECFDTML